MSECQTDDRDGSGPGLLGRRRFIAGAATLGAGAAMATSTGVAHAYLPHGASRFVPLPRQIRFADTRSPGEFPFESVAADTIRVQVTGRADIPESATAVVLTMTAVNRAEGNYVSVYPAGGSQPEVSNLNMSFDLEAAANLVTVRLGAGGAVDVYSYAPSELIVDVAGYYEPVSGPVPEGRFEALSDAVRVIDTRATGLPMPGSIVEVFVDGAVPASASSVAINLTTTDTQAWGYFTCFPLDVDSPPESSNLNVNGPGETRAAAAIVKVTTGADGRRGFKVFTFGGGHVIVDIAGYFSGPESTARISGLFVPVTPERILDTRHPGQVGRLWPHWVVGAAVPGEAGYAAQAIVGNVTAVEARDPGYFTVFAADTALREVSNLNADVVDQTIANHFISRVSTHGIAVYSQSGAHILIDLAGWYVGVPAVPDRGYTNPAPPPVGPPWRIDIPALWSRGGRLGFSSQVRGGASDPIVNSGLVWHWSGTGFLGEVAHVGLFAHRTEAGSPWYNMHLLQVGDEIYLTVDGRSGDRRRFRYRVVRHDMVHNVRANTAHNVERILASTRHHPGATISLIGCARADGWPTSLDHRLTVTAELVDWVEL